MSWTDFMAWMAERCGHCGCLLTNSPECVDDECAHPDGCPEGEEYGPPVGAVQQ